ncbi:MAG: acyl carrier protein, partial [Micromonosporaceae bacterium]
AEPGAAPAAEPGAAPTAESGAEAAAGVTTEPELLPWLRGTVRSTLQLPEFEPVDDRLLVELGMESLHAVALQYQILEELGIDLPIDDLFSDRDVRALAGLLAERTPEGVVG